ncbi:MAG: hypothetical protein KGS48_03395 [Bacteroidetes bacterium]|nr:hypothetical protein [Bacteroidota bacterium]
MFIEIVEKSKLMGVDKVMMGIDANWGKGSISSRLKRKAAPNFGAAPIFYPLVGMSYSIKGLE